MMAFPCTKCGACCKRAHLIDTFEYADKEKGGCKMLVGSICSIYNFRPLICNINEVKDLLLPGLSYKDYYKIAANVCNELIEKDKIDKKYLINLKQFEV